MKNLTILIFALLFTQITALSQPCLPEGITFTTQAQIDSFQVNYPDCTEIEEDVIIVGEDITNLNGLNVVSNIGGTLTIGGDPGANPNLTNLIGLGSLASIDGDFNISGNDLLASLSGLENLAFIGGNLLIGDGYLGNPSLISLSGLENLVNIGGSLSIINNDILTSLTGLDNLTSIEGSLIIGDAVYVWGLNFFGNPLLTNISALNNLSSIGGDLSIVGNNAITNFTGLENLTEIMGYIEIWRNDNLTNIAGLNNMISIGGNLIIRANYTLTSLAGLESLASIEGDFKIFGNDVLTSLIGLENLSSVEGNLNIGDWGEGIGNPSLTNLSALGQLTIAGGVSIHNNDLLTSLDGLEGLTSIGGDLSIGANEILSDLTGLQNLTSLAGDLCIGGDYSYHVNPELTSLAGLENLTSIGGAIIIKRTESLSSLSGIENIEASSIDNLVICYNWSLSSCEVQNICDYLANPGGPVEIYANDEGCNNPWEIANACGYLLPCLPYGNYYFSSQTDIDNFSNYSDCTELESNVTINGMEITNLNGLDEVTSIDGDLNIFGNYSLTHLSGLENLTSISGDLFIYANSDLIDLAGLNSLSSIEGNIIIEHNANLNNLAGLNNLTYIAGDIRVEGNNSLTNLTGLEQLTSVGGDLKIEFNDALFSLSGLEGLNYVGQQLRINNNDVLPGLQGLENIDASSLGSLYITFNHSLSTCEAESICNYLVSPNGNINIYENLSGCNSPEEVEEICLFSCLPEGIEFYSQLDIDSFLDNFPNCVKIEGNVTISGEDIFNLNALNSLKYIGGNLEISGNDILSCLSGLESIHVIGGNLSISDNNILSSLSGLNNLSNIEGTLEVSGNDELVSLSGLLTITSIGGILHIENNATIANLWGLENIVPGSISELHIIDNTSLAECDIQNVCEYLAIPGATIQINNNAQGCNSKQEVEEACENHCLSDGITFNTQEEIDNFHNNYPLCNKIDGNVKIKGNDITNLNGLNTLTFIGGDLKILENPSLSDLTGLENLGIVRNSLFVDNNELLSSFAGLENLESILSDGLTIGTLTPEGGNPSLTSLAGLSNLTYINGGLFINYNPGLTSLVGLDSLSVIDGGIEIRFNESLSNITALSNINPDYIDSLILRYNTSLSDCAIQSICSYLMEYNGYAWINGNETGCNSPEEVEDACDTVSVQEISFEDTFTIAPNPLESNAAIIYTLIKESTI